MERVTTAAMKSNKVTLLRVAVVAIGLLIGVLELVLAAISWLPHVRLHLIGWAVGPVVLVAPASVLTIGATSLRGLDLGILRRLPRELAIPGVAAMCLFFASFALSFLRHEPADTCEAVYRAGRYALDCHGTYRFTDAAQFFNVRALHLCWVSSGVGYFAVATALMLQALCTTPANTKPTAPVPVDGA